NSRLGVFHELVGGWIDALHTSNEDKVPCSCAEAPSANRLDCAWRIERPYAVGRVRVRRDKTCRERNCTCRKRNSRAHAHATQGRICDLSLRGSGCRGCGSLAAASLGRSLG